uniref:RNA helicase n=1 Tax=uncultured Bacillota bacterium TaxID=344338 RepID=A0A650EQP9_9FIRM|nr:RNA helicase [uncultured Firmicutes bacterium]
MKETLFSDLTLTEPIRRAIADMGFHNATEIQFQSIPVLQSGRDVIGRSQTGTGKTLAFGIPALERIQTEGELADKAQVLILCPTRELAAQACEEIQKLSKYMQGVRAVAIYGGAPMQPQIQKLKRANIVIGTPGRVMDHMRRRTLKLDAVSTVVLDEADEMLSMGFRGDIETILNDMPQQRQTVLFSATMPDEILALTRKYQKDPVTVQINPRTVTVNTIRQEFYEVAPSGKAEALGTLLQFHAPSRAIVFCNTKRTVDALCKELNRCGVSAQGLHGDMEQPQRTKVMNGFKSGSTAVLVATDVAARGIDVNDIEYVFNYDIPQDTEYYVHRIGRTGRAGKSGTAITLCGGRRQTIQLMSVAKSVKTYIKPMEMPSEEEILKRQYAVNLEKMRDLIDKQNTPELFTHMVSDLEQMGYSTKQIAAAALFAHFGEKRQKPMLSEPEEKLSRARHGRKKQGAKNSRSGAKSNHVSQSKQSANRRGKAIRPTPPPDNLPEISYVGGYTHSHS